MRILYMRLGQLPHSTRAGICACSHRAAPPRDTSKPGLALGAGLCPGAKGLGGLQYWPCGPLLLCEHPVVIVGGGPVCIGVRQWWLKSLLSVMAILVSICGLSSAHTAPEMTIRYSQLLSCFASSLHLFPLLVPLLGIVTSCNLRTYFLNAPSCFSLLLCFLLSNLTGVSFLELAEYERVGKGFRGGSFQLNMCCVSFPGDGNDILVVDSQKVIGLKMNAGSTESHFCSQGGCILLNAGTP